MRQKTELIDRSLPCKAEAPSVEGQGIEAFRSYHTANFSELLGELGASLVISTYQSGRVIMVRVGDGKLNTHFKAFQRPMGIAVAPRQLVIGTHHNVWEYLDEPEVGSKLDPPGQHDACFLPRVCHVTGQINIHEIAFVQNGLCIVNTRFSCLSMLDRRHSFVPCWRPPFITALAPEDRCHLNGLAVADGHVRWVTAFSTSDTPQGWRENRVNGGVVMEVPSGEVVTRGLSMPHSPRWYAGKLWVLESGRGTVATVDPATGRVHTVAELPGFTRGLAFAGPLAFVGLSQVRETKAFGGIPLTHRVKERLCGVWVLDLRTGKTVASLRFEGAVQEIFDVQLLHGLRCPELAEPESDLASTSFILPPEISASMETGRQQVSPASESASRLALPQARFGSKPPRRRKASNAAAWAGPHEPEGSRSSRSRSAGWTTT